MAYPVATTPFAGATPNPAYAGIFIPTLWSGKLLEKFYNATVLAAISNTDYEGEIRNQGDTVKIRSRPTITIDDYQADQALTVRRPSSNVIDLTINKGKYFNLALDDVMEIQSDLDLLSMWAEDAAEQMKIAVDTDVLTTLDTSTDIAAENQGGTAGKISGDIDLDRAVTPDDVVDYIVDCGQVLDEQNIPETGRWMVIPAWAASMIKKSDLKDASITGDGTSIARNGRLGMIDRFTLYLSNLLPTDTGVTTIYFGVNAALTFASQFTKMETLRSEQSFATLVRGLQVYGFRCVNGVAMGRGKISKAAP